MPIINEKNLVIVENNIKIPIYKYRKNIENEIFTNLKLDHENTKSYLLISTELVSTVLVKNEHFKNFLNWKEINFSINVCLTNFIDEFEKFSEYIDSLMTEVFDIINK
jgi:hypothetical protein